MTQILVTASDGTEAIIEPQAQIDVVVGGLLKGDIGPPGPAGPQGNAGATGSQGPQGATGGIVPITVSTIAPSSPGINDLWIDLS